VNLPSPFIWPPQLILLDSISVVGIISDAQSSIKARKAPYNIGTPNHLPPDETLDLHSYLLA
jgi:hypothetical protein